MKLKYYSVKLKYILQREIDILQSEIEVLQGEIELLQSEIEMKTSEIEIQVSEIILKYINSSETYTHRMRYNVYISPPGSHYIECMKLNIDLQTSKCEIQKTLKLIHKSVKSKCNS